jgi:flagellar protein FliS
MQDHIREQYLTTEVLTAPPQKLQLMLLEGAIRFANKARLLWESQHEEEAAEALIRAQEILTELICGLNGQVDGPLVRRVAGVYLFIHRALVAAQTQRDQNELNNALQVLEIERDTWRQVCQQVGTQPVAAWGGSELVQTDALPSQPAPVDPLTSRFDASSSSYGYDAAAGSTSFIA